MGQMGLCFGLESSTLCIKRKFRWAFTIPQVSASSIGSLPPSRAARPNLAFKEIEVQHATETVYYPGKPDWKPINLMLYDTSGSSTHPVFEWLRYLYDPSNDSKYNGASAIVRTADLSLLSGDGKVIESWVFETLWPQAIDFQDLDMNSSEICTCDVTLRYARAYIIYKNVGNSFNGYNSSSNYSTGNWPSPQSPDIGSL